MCTEVEDKAISKNNFEAECMQPALQMVLNQRLNRAHGEERSAM